ncbi:MAG: IPT/TIG domain-containing protein, partial [Ginsengibacter sp.]
MQWLLIFSISETYAQPVINSFSPVSGGRYKFITINGTGFSNVTAVKFGGTPALYFNSVTPGLIYATVDTGSTGNVTVQTNLGSASKPGFIFLPSPVITSIAPSTGSIGTNVTIKGSHFSSTEAVYFGGIPAQAFTVISDTIIAATVGEGASGSVFITNDGGYGFLDGFTHLGPSINSYLPPGGPPGTTVMIRGNHFTGVTGVTFEGIAASSFTILSDSVIKAVTAPGSFGTLKVSSASGAAFMPGFNIPKITSFNPQSASYNSVCTIKGINFTGATGVTFGDTAALSFTVQSDSVIEAIVGVGSFGSVKVTNTFGSGLSSGFFNFIPQVPVINSFSPDSGKSGTIITIRG